MSTTTTAPLFSADYYQNPFPTLAELRAHDPVHEFRFPVGEVRAWLITRYDDARALLADPRLSPEGRTWGNEDFVEAGLVAGQGSVLERAVTVVDPPDHTRLRKLGMRPFTPANARRWAERIREVTRQQIEACATQGHFDVMADLAGPVSSRVMGEILGLRLDRHADLVAALEQAFPSCSDDAGDAAVGFAAICAYAEELVAEKRSAPAEDLVTSLLTVANDGDRLSSEEVVAMVAAMILAGSDTVRAFLGNAVHALLGSRKQWDVIVDQPRAGHDTEDPAARAVEELLRYEGALSSALFRLATEDLVVRGRTIRRGEPVVVSLAAANRDPEVFDRPDELDLRRSGAAHLGLGHGIHNCMGSGLARLEGRIVLREVLQAFPALELRDPQAPAQYVENWAMRRLTSLPVVTGRED
ncbi:cytochrome P450 [Lolliginicoccus levis]|uniref:cytochrome P450 n=1 Tax=Lolliginicoccus levis TaxID=2919542 RepID=UPI00241C1D53|nr:cytochrome P450 [Lolliginicoccus levis]